MPLVYSQAALAPLINDQDQYLHAIDAVEEVLLQRHHGPGGHTIFCDLPLANDPNAVKMYGITSPEAASLRVFGAETNIVPRDNVAYILSLDEETGGLRALLAGDDLNPLRTSVPAALGVRHLAPDDAKVLCMLGSGQQARGCMRPLRAALPNLEEIVVWSPTPANREKFAAEYTEKFDIPVRAIASQEEAVRAADVLVAAGLQRVDVKAYEGEWVKPGALAISMTRSAPPELVETSRYVVPTTNIPEIVAIGFAGKNRPVPSGAVSGVVELADIIDGKAPARETPDQTVVFELANVYLWDHGILSWALKWAETNATAQEIELTSS